MLKLLIFVVFTLRTVDSLTCYNGMKMLAMQSVGETTEECPSSAYCYNMSTSAYVMVNVVKAGCSTWRCMLAKDTCIFTTFQAIPVSLCCCSYDRCNVGGNPVFSDNPSQISNSNSNSNWNSNSNSNSMNQGGGGGSWGNGNQQNNNGWGNNNNDWNSNYNYGGQNAAKEETMTRQTVGGADAARKKLSDKEVEAMFKKSIDDRGDEIQLEDDFKKIDKNYKTQSAAPTRTLSARKEVEHIPLGSKTVAGVGTTASTKSTGKEIQL